MKPAEVIIIREIIKESYPYAKMDNERGDDVWYMLLKDYKFEPMNEVLINYIKQGNKFAPSIAELISLYTMFYKQQATGVVAEMDNDGYFDDPPGTAAETAIWNHNNRLRKAIMWSESGNMPDWFREDYMKYKNRLYPQQITTGKAKMLT
jgi:hypothetical protein